MLAHERGDRGAGAVDVELDELTAVVPPPLTVSPTLAPIDAIVPLVGAVSVV